MSAVFFLAFPALGQARSNQQIGEMGSTNQNLTLANSERLNGAAKVTDLIGMTVNNYQNVKLGKVSDLALDMKSGRIVQVIITSGGFLGIGTTLTAVPPGALHQNPELKILQLDSSPEKYNAAPQVDTAIWEEGTRSNRLSETFGYYGQQTYISSEGYETNDSHGTFTNSLPRNMENNNSHVSTLNSNGTWSRTNNPNLNGSEASWAKAGYIQKASKLIGTSVINLKGENLGKLENLTVALASGRIVAVIISTGHYLGMENELSAVPPSALRFDIEEDTFQLDASEGSLASSPHFSANEWPDLNQSDYVGKVYRAYNVEPYFTSEAVSGEDITRIYVRDRDDRMLTLLNCGDSMLDADITAQIRKEIIADSAMTSVAHNVKIITLNSHVTLSGEVNTADEKSRIAAIADRIASAGNVDNRLEVSTDPKSY